MAHILKFHADRPLVYLKLSGEVSSETCRQIFAELKRTAGWSAEVPCLVDHSDVGWYSGGYAAFQQVAASLSASGLFTAAKMPLVYFAPTDLGYGIARMVQQTLASQLGFDVHVFRDEGQALAQLGHPEIQLRDLLASGA